MRRCEANGFPDVSRPTPARYLATPQRLLAPMIGYRDRERDAGLFVALLDVTGLSLLFRV